jgi:hypothetical protein
MKLTQYVAKDIGGPDIGSLFKKKESFEPALLALQNTQPALSQYLATVRTQFTEQLAKLRNDIEHQGLTKP